MLTLLHAADLHLDSPFRSLPPREAQERRAGQRQMLEALRDLALERQVDLVLLAGDLFDSAQVYPETLEALSRTLGALPCPVCIAPGNHDYFAPQSPYVRHPWPGNVHIFSSETVTCVVFPELGVTVYGYAFTGSVRGTDPLAGFVAPRDGTVPIGVFHGDVGKTGGYAPIAPDSLAQSGLAYAALGHVHSQTPIHADQPTPWAYSGCAQGRGFDEVGPKGCYLVQIADDGGLSFEFCELPGPRYWVMSIPVVQDPARAVRQALGEDYLGDYVRLTLTGEAETPDLAALTAELAGLCRVLELRDETLPPQDLWARSGEDNLTGFFLREMGARLEGADEKERPLLLQALRYGMAALEGREEPR